MTFWGELVNNPFEDDTIDVTYTEQVYVLA